MGVIYDVEKKKTQSTV